MRVKTFEQWLVDNPLDDCEFCNNNRHRQCLECLGSGETKNENEDYIDCWYCNATGKVKCSCVKKARHFYSQQLKKEAEKYNQWKEKEKGFYHE